MQGRLVPIFSPFKRNAAVNESLSMGESQQRTGQSEEGEIELSIVMPCLNEAETLETCIRKARYSERIRSPRGDCDRR